MRQWRERVTRRQLRYVLLEYPLPIRFGMLCEWHSKHVGAGIYDLWLEEQPWKGKA